MFKILLYRLLEVAVESGASDLHLSPGIPPFSQNLWQFTSNNRL